MCVWAGSRSDRPLARLLGRGAARQQTSDVRACANACQTALDIRETIDRFNARHAIPLRTRVGLHVGKVAMGPVGGEYHVIGDVPNTASRIQGLNKQLGTTILASDAVVQGQEGLVSASAWTVHPCRQTRQVVHRGDHRPDGGRRSAHPRALRAIRRGAGGFRDRRSQARGDVVHSDRVHLPVRWSNSLLSAALFGRHRRTSQQPAGHPN